MTMVKTSITDSTLVMVPDLVTTPLPPHGALWWRMRRQGVELPAEPDVIVVDGAWR